MFKTSHNLAKLVIELGPETPFLIKGKEGMNPTRPDMEFVRMRTPYGESLYVPGSSLKGVVRSAAEALLRAMGTNVCDVLDLRSGTCPARHGRSRDKLPYEQHCDVCKTFGSTDMAGRVTFGDLLPWPVTEENAEQRCAAVGGLNRYLSTRHSVTIDRRTGQAKGAALFEMETLCGGSFYGEVVARNYTLWQLALLSLIFDRIDDGSLRLGFGKSRGLGRVRLRLSAMTVEQFGPLRGGTQLRGIPDAGEEGVALPVAAASTGFGERYHLDKPALDAVRETLVGLLARKYGAAA